MSRPDEAFGWRKRIGILSPTVIETAAYDFHRLAPDGVAMCAITSNVEHWSKENFKESVLDPLIAHAKYLASRNVDFIMHCGMPVVTTRGKGFEEEIVKIITDATGIPASTSIRSAIRALAHLRIRNVALLSPYPPELHQSALAFLKASGFSVVAEHTEDVVFKRLQDVTPAHIAAAAARLVKSGAKADGIYIPCNQWSAADAAPIIERETGLPVVTGSHADHWEAFRVLGINDPIEGHGRLMASLSKEAPARRAHRGVTSMSAFIRSLVALAAVLLSYPFAAQAQDFPNKPVRFVVPYAAGGSGDLLARLLGDKLAKLWGQQVVVDNKPGAGGIIGTEAAAHADADGYTIYLATDGPITIAPTLHKKPLPYDWKRDFTPVSMMAVGYQILLSSPKLPAANLKDFIALAKSEPGKYNFASIGIGSAPHMSAENFLSVAGLKLAHVPYRGSSQQAIAALISGDVQMFVVGTSTAVPFVKAGTVHGLAVTSPTRLDSLPNVPTFAELGMPNVDYSIWFAVLAPSATPKPILKKLNEDIAKAVADPEYKSALHARGFEAMSNSPEQLAAFLDKDYLRSKSLIEKLGLKVE